MLGWFMKKIFDVAWDYIKRTPIDKMKKNAENGDAQAQYTLGLMYYVGDKSDEKASKNYSEAFKWIRREKISKNYPEALKWIRRAAEENEHR